MFLIFFLCLFFWPLQEVIRVILGNLDDLHPFSTDHFTVFPCILSFLLIKEKIQWLVSVGHCISQHSCVRVCRSLTGVVLLQSLQFDIGWRYCGHWRCCLHQRADVTRVFCSVSIQTALRSKLGLARASEGVYKVPRKPTSWLSSAAGASFPKVHRM